MTGEPLILESYQQLVLDKKSLDSFLQKEMLVIKSASG